MQTREGDRTATTTMPFRLNERSYVLYAFCQMRKLQKNLQSGRRRRRHSGRETERENKRMNEKIKSFAKKKTIIKGVCECELRSYVRSSRLYGTPWFWCRLLLSLVSSSCVEAAANDFDLQRITFRMLGIGSHFVIIIKWITVCENFHRLWQMGGNGFIRNKCAIFGISLKLLYIVKWNRVDWAMVCNRKIDMDIR